ncbi:MAG: hypothetical protein J5680_01955, partial [Neisseriaceae bacterium]|nr:hypothetical protein [Neisseriaceae bacterium]
MAAWVMFSSSLRALLTSTARNDEFPAREVLSGSLKALILLNGLLQAVRNDELCFLVVDANGD